MSAQNDDTEMFARPKAPWDGVRGLSAILERWENDPKLWRNIALDHEVAERVAKIAALPSDLQDNVRRALAKRGITELYSHQAEAYERAMRGESLVVSTPTASGKSLCYNLPVLQRFASEPGARA